MDTLILSGPIGAGKTSAGNIILDVLSRKGITSKLVVLDAIGHDVLADDTSVMRGLVDAFGTRILSPEGEIDRSALAAVAFFSPENAEILNECTHGKIGERLLKMRNDFLKSDPEGILVIECPFPVNALFGYDTFKDIFATSKVIVLQSRRELRVNRKTSIPPEDVIRRDRLQHSKGEYTGDYMVINDGTRDDLVSSLEKIIEREAR